MINRNKDLPLHFTFLLFKYDPPAKGRQWRIFAGEKGFFLGYRPNLFFKKS
jgi:hypothetical protein